MSNSRNSVGNSKTKLFSPVRTKAVNNIGINGGKYGNNFIPVKTKSGHRPSKT